MMFIDGDLPRNCWKLGRVTELPPSSDGHVRRVRLDIGTSKLCKDGKRSQDLVTLERTIQKLIIIAENDI